MPNKYELLQKGQSDAKTLGEALKKYPRYKELLASLARNIRQNSLETGEIEIRTDKTSLKISLSAAGTGKIRVTVEDTSAKENFPGTAYFSNWNGYFYRLPHLKKKPYVKDGQRIKKGAPIGTIFVSKNEQFILDAPQAGRISFPQKDDFLSAGQTIKKDETLLFRIIK